MQVHTLSTGEPSTKSLINSMLSIEQLLSNGERLILFPEGTTSLNNSIKNFNSFFFSPQ